jgi:hypothetical protein
MMDSGTYANLEKLLTAARVPRSLWPRYFERETERELRRQFRNEQDYRSMLARTLQNDCIERERRRKFSMFLMLMLWLILEQQRQQQQPRLFAQRAFRTLMNSEHGYGDAEIVGRGIACACVAAGMSESGARDALEWAATDKDGRGNPHRAALRHLDAALAERERDEQQQPEPAPTAEPQPAEEEEQQEEEQQNSEPTDDQLDDLMSPSW